jgi:hypothetical protein
MQLSRRCSQWCVSTAVAGIVEVLVGVLGSRLDVFDLCVNRRWGDDFKTFIYLHPLA